jgi:Ser/Thr protein kinase RdoA (MazF antagonist)
VTTTSAPARDWIADGIAEAWDWEHLELRPVPARVRGSGQAGGALGVAGTRPGPPRRVPAQPTPDHPAGDHPTPDAAAASARTIEQPDDLLVVVWVDGLPRALTRVLRPGTMSVTAVESEVAWMTALGADGVVRTPTVLPTRTGTAVGVLDGPRQSRWVAVSLAFDPALVEAVEAPTDAAGMAALGTLAARLHAHARAWQPPHWFRRPTVAVTELAGPTSGPTWEDHPLGESALRLLGTAQEEALDVLSWAGEPSGLVHGDLRDAVSGDLLRSFDCRWTWWEQDLAGSLSGLEDRIGAPSLAKAWLDAYRDHGQVLDPRLAGALVMLRRLTLLTGDPDLAEGTLDVATRFMRSPSWLVD